MAERKTAKATGKSAEDASMLRHRAQEEGRRSRRKKQVNAARQQDEAAYATALQLYRPQVAGLMETDELTPDQVGAVYRANPMNFSQNAEMVGKLIHSRSKDHVRGVLRDLWDTADADPSFRKNLVDVLKALPPHFASEAGLPTDHPLMRHLREATEHYGGLEAEEAPLWNAPDQSTSLVPFVPGQEAPAPPIVPGPRGSSALVPFGTPPPPAATGSAIVPYVPGQEAPAPPIVPGPRGSSALVPWGGAPPAAPSALVPYVPGQEAAAPPVVPGPRPTTTLVPYGGRDDAPPTQLGQPDPDPSEGDERVKGLIMSQLFGAAQAAGVHEQNQADMKKLLENDLQEAVAAARREWEREVQANFVPRAEVEARDRQLQITYQGEMERRHAQVLAAARQEADQLRGQLAAAENEKRALAGEFGAEMRQREQKMRTASEDQVRQALKAAGRQNDELRARLAEAERASAAGPAVGASQGRDREIEDLKRELAHVRDRAAEEVSRRDKEIERMRSLQQPDTAGPDAPAPTPTGGVRASGLRPPPKPPAENDNVERPPLIHSERPSPLEDAEYARRRRPPIVRGFAVPQTPVARMVAEAASSGANNLHASTYTVGKKTYHPHGVGFGPPRHPWGGPPKPPPSLP